MWRYVKSKLYVIALVLFLIGGISPGIADASREIRTNICGDFSAPTITAPTSGFTTQEDSVVVAGTGESSLSVTIIDNGSPVAVTLIASSGEYSATIPLSNGANAITAKETNPCGTVKESEVITIQRTAPVQPPTNGSDTSQITAPSAVAPVIAGQSSSNPLEQPVPSHQNDANFNAPVILRPTPGTTFTVNTVWISGAAEPSSLVTLYVNGVSVAKLRASVAGSFGATVELNIGSNRIQVVAEKDGKSAISSPTTITYTPEKSNKKPASPIEVIGLVSGMAITAVAATGVGVWVVKLMSARRLR